MTKEKEIKEKKKKSTKKKKAEDKIIDTPAVEKPLQPGLTRIVCLHIRDIEGNELSFKDVKESIDEGIISEINIFTASNRLIKQITNYLTEQDIKYYVHGHSRIVLYR